MQDLARQIKDGLSASHDVSTAAGPDTAARHKKLLQDFAALLQASVGRRQSLCTCATATHCNFRSRIMLQTVFVTLGWCTCYVHNSGTPNGHLLP
jgi:hypothetical protein